MGVVNTTSWSAPTQGSNPECNTISLKFELWGTPLLHFLFFLKWYDDTINRSTTMKQRWHNWPPKQNMDELDQPSKIKPTRNGVWMACHAKVVDLPRTGCGAFAARPPTQQVKTCCNDMMLAYGWRAATASTMIKTLVVAKWCRFTGPCEIKKHPLRNECNTSIARRPVIKVPSPLGLHTACQHDATGGTTTMNTPPNSLSEGEQVSYSHCDNWVENYPKMMTSTLEGGGPPLKSILAL